MEQIQALLRIIMELQAENDRLKKELEAEKVHANAWLTKYIKINSERTELEGDEQQQSEVG